MPLARLDSVGDYLGVIRRRKWILLIVVVLTVSTAALLSARQTPLYSASAQVLLNQSAKISPTGSGITPVDQSRYDTTEATLAHTVAVARRALTLSHTTSVTPTHLLTESSIASDPSSDVLTFTITDPNRGRAVRMANSYARAFVPYQSEVATRSIRDALRTVNRNVAKVSRDFAKAQHAGSASAALASRLSLLAAQEQNLQSLLALQQGGAIVSELAGNAAQTQPKLVRNVLIGGVIGLALGIALAFLLDSLDTRVRRSEDVGEYLSLPLLGRLPTPPHRLRSKDALVMLSTDGRAQSDAFRQLRLSIDFANLDVRARSIMITSPIGHEGKTTTAANLAIAFAQGGRRVILADFDLREAGLGRFFDVGEPPGITDVAIGRASLDEALVPMSISDPRGGGLDRSPMPDALVGSVDERGGTIQLLLSGSRLSNPADFLESALIPEIMNELTARADIVIIDTAPVIPVSDTISLSKCVDAAVVVVNAGLARTEMLIEARRLLDTFPARLLGFVETASERDDRKGVGRYGYGYGYGGGSGSSAGSSSAQGVAFPSLRGDAESSDMGFAMEESPS